MPRVPVHVLTVGFATGAKRRFSNEYTVEKDLGTKRTTKIVENASGATFLAKVFKRKYADPVNYAELPNEVSILMALRHPKFVRLHDHFNDESRFYMIFEYCEGGDLFDRVVAKTKYAENEAQVVMRNLLQAFQHLHNECNVMHRDVSPENIYLTSRNSDVDVKVGHFTFARRISDEDTRPCCGTPSYVAPEILRREVYGVECDIWSLGVVCYILLCGFPPFYSEDLQALYHTIMAGGYDFPAPYWDGASDTCKDFVCRMLHVDRDARWTATQLLQHPWLTGQPLPASSDTPIALTLSARAQVEQIALSGGIASPAFAPAALADCLPAPPLAEARYGGSTRSFPSAVSRASSTRDIGSPDALLYSVPVALPAGDVGWSRDSASDSPDEDMEGERDGESKHSG